MSRYRTTMAELLKKVQEDGHEDVASSKRMCQTIIEDATQIRTKLDSMGPEDKLDTWWTNKLAKSADNMNSARDYIMNPIEESFELDEGRMKDIYTMQQDGKSAKEIAKLMKLPVKTVKDILGESNLRYSVKFSYSKGGKIANAFYQSKDEAEKFVKSVIAKGGKAIMTTEEGEIEESLDEFTTNQINMLKKSYGGMRGKTIAPQKANFLSKHLDRLDLFSLRQLVKEKIPFLATLARNKIYKRTGKFEELEERTYDPTMFGPDKVAKAMAIATKSSGNYTKAVKDIEKIARNLSKVSTIARELKKQNEQVEQPEKEKKETENKDSVIATLKDQIAMLKQKLENEKNKAVKPEPNPDTGEVPLTIGLANKLLKDKEMKKEDLDEDFVVKYQHYKTSPMGAAAYKNKKDAEKFRDSVLKQGGKAILTTRAAFGGKTLKNSVTEADLTKPQIKKVHKMADELPKKDFKDRYGKEKGDAVRYATATNIVKKKLGIKEDKADMMFKKLSQRAQTYVNELLRSGMGTMEAIQKAKEKFKEGDMKNEEIRLRVEAIAGLKKKAEKSGMPYSILKKVYDRGMAAWKGGHRPGASQHQWAFARVNSFVTKSSGTWGGADKDLAAKVRASK